MRQLYIAVVLFVVVCFGTYYLVTQQFNYDKYYPSNYIPMAPNPPIPTPRPVRPGPLLPGPPSPFPQPSKLRAVGGRSLIYKPSRVNAPILPVVRIAPTITPLPVPVYAPVTPMARVHTAPPIVPPTFAPVLRIPQTPAPPSPSPSPSP